MQRGDLTMKFSSRDIEEQKKYIRENFKDLEGYASPEMLEEEKRFTEKYCETFNLDASDIEIKYLCEKRQRRSDYFGSEGEMWYQISEHDRECFFDFLSDIKNTSENREEPPKTMEERFLKDFNFHEDTSKMSPIEKRRYRARCRNMFKYHMLQQIYDLLCEDPNYEDFKEAWYSELVERANKEAVNQAYLKGYKDGHRDGYNDCMRNKHEQDYDFPEVEDSEYYLKKEVESPRENLKKQTSWLEADEIPF